MSRKLTVILPALLVLVGAMSLNLRRFQRLGTTVLHQFQRLGKTALRRFRRPGSKPDPLTVILRSGARGARKG